jgi:phosphoribosylamine--glycine ligase
VSAQGGASGKRVLVVGSGAREHALASRIARGGSAASIVCAPGNGGTAALGENVPVAADDVPGIVAAARARAIDFVVVGPEAPLVAGLVDALGAAGIPAFGPSREAARLEASKAFSKHFMARHGIPTAAFAVFDDADRASSYLREQGRPLVVKADGLAAGKGVVVASDVPEALDAVDRFMRKRVFGAAGATVVIEEPLVGEEVSYHVVSDGERFVALAAAQDHKRVCDGDRGPNTGGMGAYSPPPVVTRALEARILDRVVVPTLDGLRGDGIRYRGALFVGLMIVDGEPYALEYNVRFGDPEAQTMMARLGGDPLPLLLGSAQGDLRGVTARWEAPASLCVVVAAGGYPGEFAKGAEITGIDRAAEVEGVEVFHAGTARDGERLCTSGGRVLSVAASGPDIDTAAERAYAAVDRIRFDGAHARRDIGWRARTR